jgi:hypothetical protein
MVTRFKMGLLALAAMCSFSAVAQENSAEEGRFGFYVVVDDFCRSAPLGDREKTGSCQTVTEGNSWEDGIIQATFCPMQFGTSEASDDRNCVTKNIDVNDPPTFVNFYHHKAYLKSIKMIGGYGDDPANAQDLDRSILDQALTFVFGEPIAECTVVNRTDSMDNRGRNGYELLTISIDHSGTYLANTMISCENNSVWF